jgi:hypothetical protein
MTEETSVLKVPYGWVRPENFTGCIELPSGLKEWFLNGQLHRDGGPAFERYDGYSFWFKNGKLHRENGPAREWWDGTRQWYFNDHYFWGNAEFLLLEGNYIVVERGIPTSEMFGDLKLTHAKLLMAKGTVFVYDNLPGGEIGETNDVRK